MSDRGGASTPVGALVLEVTGALAQTLRSRLAAALWDAVTSRPNGVILDLTGAERTEDPSLGLADVLRAVDVWPHAPILVVADDRTRAAITARTTPGSVEVSPSLTTARATYAARPWVSSTVTTLRPPLTSRALARGLVLEFAESRGLRHRLDAAMLAADELTARASRLASGRPHGLQLRLATRDGMLGVAVADLPTPPGHGRSEPRAGTTALEPDAGDELAIVGTLADAYGLVRRPDGGTLAWSVFAWGRTAVQVLAVHVLAGATGMAGAQNVDHAPDVHDQPRSA